MTDTKTYVINKQCGLYTELKSLLISLQAIFFSMELLRTGTVQYAEGDYAVIECKLVDIQVHLPLYGPIQAMMKNIEPDFIEITVSKKTKVSHTHFYSGMNRQNNSIANSMLLIYFESHRSVIKKAYGERSSWPDSWQMGWAIRNALAHNGNVFNSPKRSPVNWCNYSIAPSDEPRQKILSDINGADIFLLLIEMEDARTGVSLPCR